MEAPTPRGVATRLATGLVVLLGVLASQLAIAGTTHAATAVSGVWVVPGNASQTITWEAAAGNTHYRIYRSTSSGTLGALVATVAAPNTSWTDSGLANGTSYYYTVRGWDGAAESGDPVQQMVSTGTSFATGRWWDDCAAELDGRIWLFGGYRGGSNDTNEIVSFDTTTSTVATSTHTLPTDRYWCGAERVGGRIYLFGGGNGTNGATLYSDILRFDPASGVTSMNATLPTARYQSSAEVLADGTISVIGGQAGSTLYPNVLRYDPVADPAAPLSSWLSLTYPNGGVAIPGVDAIDGNPIAVGGNMEGSGTMEPGQRTNVTNVTFGPDTFTESIPAAPPNTRMGAGVAALNDRLYVVGGASYASEASRCSGFTGCSVTNSILGFDPRSGTWTTLAATAPTAQMRRSAFQVKGFVYVVGGNNGSTLSPGGFDAVVYRFDPGGQARGTPGSPRFATAPSALAAAPGNRRATLSWTGGTSIDRYRIFRSTASGQLGSLIEEQAGGQSAPTTSITDTALTNGTTYWYTVTAIGYDGHETAATAQVSVTPYAPPGPTTLAQFRDDGTTAIASGAITVDGTTNDVVLRFDVSHQQAGRTLTPWVELSSTGSFAQACGASVAGVTFSGPPVTAPLASTSYPARVDVTGLAAGTTWYWRACVVDDVGVDGDWAARGGAPDFRTNGAPVAVHVTPAADAWIGTDEPTFTAQHTDVDSHSGQVRFEVCTSNPADPWSATCGGGSWQRFDAPSGLVAGASTSYSPYRPLPEGDSWWRVRSTDSLGTVGSWSVRRVRVDLTPPTTPTDVAQLPRGMGRVELSWTASADSGAGGITYDVEYSSDGTTYTTAAGCAAIPATTCTVTGLGSKSIAILRVRACDAVGNCTIWQGRAGVSAEDFFLRSSLNSVRLTSANNRRATTTSAADNTNTSVTHSNATGWYPIRPGVAGSTTNVGATEPADTPYASPSGTGWVVDDTTGRALSPGDIQVTMTANSSSATGAGDLQCRAYRVTSSAGSITAATLLGKAFVGTDVLSGTASTVRTCTAATIGSTLQLAAGESIYVELWLRVTTAGASGASVALHVEGTQSAVSIPSPGTAPNVPVLTSPADGATTGGSPTVAATYAHPLATGGFLEFEVATSSAFGASIVQTGTSALLANGAPGSLVTGPLPANATYSWRARAVDTSGLASGWSTAWTFTTSGAPSRPTNVTPTDGGTSGSTTPSLTSSAFADPDVGDTHQASRWQLVIEGQPWSAPAFDSGVAAGSTSWTTPALTVGTSYAWRVRHQDSSGLWSAWSVPTQFTASAAPAITLSVDRTTITSTGVLPQSNRFETFVATVSTANAAGYRLEAVGTATGSLGATCGGCAAPFSDWGGTDADPSPWTDASEGFLGLTVRDATGGRLGKWGPGTNTAETDIVANEYAGLSSASPLVLHDRASAIASDPVVVTIRARAASTTSAVTHSETIALTAIANP